MYRQYKQCLAFLLLTLCAVCGVTHPALAADAVTYQDAAWNETTKTVDFTEKTCDTYTSVTSDLTAWNEGWYVVNSNVTISSRITVTGDVHLILADGAELTASSGITVTGGNTLEIYGQSDGTGKLTAASSGSSAIGVGDGWGSPAVGDLPYTAEM